MASAKVSGSEKKVVIAKTPSELQKMKLDKLMKDPNKEVFIPEKSKDWNPRGPQEFIRNVWGSSAGAGSGDFHVYRGVRRREYARQKFINEKAIKDSQEAEYQKRVEENKKNAEKRTAKKRAKRLKRKAQKKARKDDKKEEKSEEESEEDDEEEEKNQSQEKLDNSSDNVKGDNSLKAGDLRNNVNSGDDNSDCDGPKGNNSCDKDHKSEQNGS